MGLASPSAVKVVKQDKMYLAFLAVSCAGFSSLAARDFVALGTSRRFAATAIKECATMLDLHNAGEKNEGDKNASGSSAVAVKSKKKGKRSRGGGRSDKVGADFWKELSYLVKVAMPNPYCRFSQLLAAQFTLLVMRTLLTVRANKVNTYYLSKAISSANWQFWVRWFLLWRLDGFRRRCRSGLPRPSSRSSFATHSPDTLTRST